MEILMDSNRVITSFATCGHLDGGTVYTGLIPDDFDATFCPGFYKLSTAGNIEKNDGYVAPSESIDNASSAAMDAINMLGIQVAQLAAKVKA